MFATYRPLTRLAIPLALLLFAACAPSTDGTDGSGWTLESDAAGDTTPPPDDGGMRDAYPTTFRLKNAGNASIRVQVFQNCRRNPPGWLKPDIGGGLATGPGCRYCDCQTVREQGGCRVCGAPDVCRAPSVEKVPAGETVSWEWSGVRHLDDQIDGQSCKRRDIPAYGEQMTATFCWSAESGPTGDNMRLDDPECKTVEFRYAQRTLVTHEVSPKVDAEPEPTTFILENQFGDTVDVVRPNICHPPDKPWVSITRDGSTFDFTTDCTVCNCESANDGFCSVCEIACPRNEPIELTDGGSKRLNWEGVGYRRRQLDSGQTCHAEHRFEVGDQLTVRFCWTQPSYMGDAVMKTICEQKTFEYGAATVRHVVRPQ